ncbi:hypothetical protein GR217_22690 [Rhizobium leguminosarum]|uniref:DUF5623 domain-containing protein n=1 Tax=Rhizobium ruizarguesonis TaxID=2081791 RepID=A0AAE4YSM1_9HYPH|nr:hypothetical protein [Rhizobium ruizarguesonis]NEI50495.1 hypothetical protein [Rhizobium ruizarguesonis]
MRTLHIRPTSVEGIKRLAKTISKQENVVHAAALDTAATRAGFANYIHAYRALSSSTKGVRAAPLFTTYISVPWRDAKTRQRGLEIIKISLSKPLDEMIKPTQYKHARGLWFFARWVSDQLAYQGAIDSPDLAIARACGAARTLQFMAATGLRPSSGSKTEPRGDGDTRIPGLDHSSTWYDPESRKYVVLDEPYSGAVSNRSAERAAWAEQHNWEVIKPEWPGMYYPDGGCELYLMADRKKGLRLDLLAAALKSLGPAVIPENCERVVVPEGETFLSPGELARAAMKAARKASHN